MLNYSAPLNALQNKTILITGAGAGIGKTAAITFAKHGATVILLGRTVKKLESVYDEIVNAGYPEPAIVPLDMQGATKKHYQDMANTIISQFGKLDGVLQNASVLGHLEPFKQIEEDIFNQVMQINLNSQFLMTQALLEVLELAPKASVIFTSSSVGSQGRAYWGSYAISKFATEGMMQVLADEYAGSSLRFNCINPGATRTSMRSKAFPGEDASTLKAPEDIMPLYLYLMSDDSQEENGKTFVAQPKS
ncbi:MULTISPECIES: YciK family oxidoreductase [Aliiglaciecola]|uniref:YciK family oxidoreductase n=1 Tax=Aliiglaciecola TaxID=1406885 RepID=UPI001C096494|nr:MULTISPECIES: YciK family oxidoreductase [Aliiglaciecola]MBU2876140.1 YciK family oxidoreductase [Aliiglaciecola lipolytica]MDO6712234.1 YciK family oxidoreductase [Aliiglaciecola sp. 2_MG-2023]MDO6753528.1 YciK family oxidoreductase [Aliiglaciecola sp. 1_MG-2023]